LLLRDGLAPGRFPDLQFVLVAGEAFPPADANAWIRCFGERVRLANLYGPSETTLAKFCYRLPATPIVDSFVPIGMPIPGVQAILLDEHLAPCAQGELGEIHIRTPYRTLGYYNDPDSTASAFIRNPFSAGADDILYRTGDLARELPDGNFRFAGRKDFQLKIGGNRVELGEIEARLMEHPGVREAVVVARLEHPGDARLVAYYVPRESNSGRPAVSAPELRRHLADVLPRFMVPAQYVVLENLPLGVNGKIDRGALPAPGTGRPELAEPYAPPIGDDEKHLCDAFAATLGIDRVGRQDNFFELGGDSMLAISLLAQLQAAAASAIPVTLIFGNPTPASLVVALAKKDAGAAIEVKRLPDAYRSASNQVAAAKHVPGKEPVAIIAMAGRFPGASDVEQFWDNLCAGRDSITVFRPDELDPSIPEADRQDPAYVAARGIIDGVEDFDAGFFGISPHEAELMDPQHRVFLELCWECMERAGQVPDATTVPVGVFAGTYHSTYLHRHVAAHPDLVENVGAYQVTLDNEKDYIATRIAHKLNLTGPAISMYTACSTSLVAICQAMDSLRAGACDMALAGGVSIICPPRRGQRYQEGAMFSPDGRTRTFDAKAEGTAFSDGAAVVLLKRLPDALEDGDPVHAVILGGAVNNDGGGKASFTAPSSDGQAAVIAMAQDNAGISPRSISYVEAHGTATPMGDPIEIEGLEKAFRRGTSDVGFCRIGSVKTNVGHLVIAAGAAGVIKTAMALEQQKIPASLHFDRANPVIDFHSSPFVVNASLSAWNCKDAPRRAGVSSFGVGGTNAHVVLEQAPPLPRSDAQTGPNLLLLSARSPAAAEQAASRLADFLQADMEHSQYAAASGSQASTALNLADVAWTLAVGRKSFAHRAAVVATRTEDAISQLRSDALAAEIDRSGPARHRDPVFMFPGQGSQYAGMGRALYETEPEFAAAFDECVEELRSGLGLDLRTPVFSDDPAGLLPTGVMQPAIFAVEYSLARLWMSRGIMPAAMIGHSVGEFVAGTLAGVFTLQDALRLVARRGALMQAQPAGGMLSVRASLDALLARLPPDLSLAAENAPGSCVVAGPLEAIARFQAQLDGEHVACRLLHTSHAFHSQMMEPVVDPFRAEVAALKLSAPSVPLVSTATGDWLDADSATSPDYWARHLRRPVRFATALGRVLDSPARVLLEVGPRTTLTALSRQHPGVQQHHVASVATLADAPETECASFLRAAGQLWTRGVVIDQRKFDRRRARRRVRLPTYPFERRRFWVEAAPAIASTLVSPFAGAPRRRASDAAMSVAPSNPKVTVEHRLRVLDARPNRRARLLAEVRNMIAEISGMAIADDEIATNFIELGLDSLTLTQVALHLQKTFTTRISFRQLMNDCASLDRLAAALDQGLPPGELSLATTPIAATDGAMANEVVLHGNSTRALMDAAHPITAGARLGRQPDGRPAWFIADPNRGGKYLKVGT
jgi:acyl transferase domain-containing protein